MDMEIMLNQTSQALKDRHSVISPICEIEKSWADRSREQNSSYQRPGRKENNETRRDWLMGEKSQPDMRNKFRCSITLKEDYSKQYCII